MHVYVHVYIYKRPFAQPLAPPLPSPAGRSRLGYYLYMAQISSLSDPKSISNGRTDGYIHTYMQQQQHSASLLFEI